MLYFSMSNRIYFGGSTYDSFHGWLTWGNDISLIEIDDADDDDYSYIYQNWGWEDRDDANFLVEKTKDGRLFEAFPYPPENITYSVHVCLESLNNGGDIFTTTSGFRNNKNPATYIFRMNSSAWERQPDLPDVLYDSKFLHKRHKSWTILNIRYLQVLPAGL